MAKRKPPNTPCFAPGAIEKLRASIQAGDAPAARNQTPEESARALLDEIQFSVAMSFARSRSFCLPDTDSQVVRGALDSLMISFEYLAARMPDDCFGHLEELLRAAHMIGGLTVISPQAAKPYVALDLNCEQAERARAGNSKRKAILMQAVRDEVEVEAMSPKRKMAVSEAYARLIQPGVSRRLAGLAEYKWPPPSLKTIQNCLSEIKKRQS